MPHSGMVARTRFTAGTIYQQHQAPRTPRSLRDNQIALVVPLILTVGARIDRQASNTARVNLPPMLPTHEIGTHTMTVIDAVDLSAEGKVADGDA
jgi:hypothetical protein